MSAANEWLETDGLGGYAMGTTLGPPSRRYHALLVAPVIAPALRTALVNAMEVWLEENGDRTPLWSVFYSPGVLEPDNTPYLESFSATPWPTWRYRTKGGGAVLFELCIPRGATLSVLSWRYEGTGSASLFVRPLISVRDHHSLHYKNEYARTESRIERDRVYWRPYHEAPEIVALSSGRYQPSPYWYERVLLQEEAARGYPSVEDLLAPGVFEFSLSKEKGAFLIFGEAYRGERFLFPKESCEDAANRLRSTEATRRSSFPSVHFQAGEDFIVQRGKGLTILAGYPWFTDWGRDTFISMRGLCIAQKKYEEALAILSQWTTSVNQGMLPNRFLDDRSSAAINGAEYNSVDAALWFIIAAFELIEGAKRSGRSLPSAKINEITSTIEVILQHYSQGTRYGIQLDTDGLLLSGTPGTQLTWMDAKVGDYVVTPRIGKPVEVQALWLNALRIGSLLLTQTSDRWKQLYERGTKSFGERFFNESRGCLFDVIDAERVYARNDERVRPNQLYAVGGLPFSIVTNEQGRRIVETVQSYLLTPMGLRTLAPGERGYAAHYVGDPDRRNLAYHQGTVWPYLMGPFIEAWVRVRGGTDGAKQEAKLRFLTPLLERSNHAARGHLPEIADAEPPFTPRGCPFQAWSIAEALRMKIFLEEVG